MFGEIIGRGRAVHCCDIIDNNVKRYCCEVVGQIRPKAYSINIFKAFNNNNNNNNNNAISFVIF